MNKMTRTSLGFAAIAGIMCAASSVSRAADILAAGSIFGGFTQSRAVCYVYNAGSSPIKMTIPHIYNEFGQSQTLVVNQCGHGLGAGLSCGVAADIVNNETYSCKVAVLPSKQDVRGILEVRDANQNVLQNIELR